MCLTEFLFLTVCPEDGWVSFANNSYLIIDIPTFNWTHARRICQMLGGDLAIIRSAAENAFILRLVIKQSKVQIWGVWLGSVRKADNKFYWIDGTAMANGYTAWGRGEPNNAFLDRSLNENCGNMFGKEDRPGKWNDLACSLPAGKYLKYTPVILCKKKAN